MTSPFSKIGSSSRRPSFVRRIAELEGTRINVDDRALVEFGFAPRSRESAACDHRDATDHGAIVVALLLLQGQQPRTA